MWKYIIKRLLFIIPVLIFCTFVVFFIMNIKPGDPGRSVLGIMASQEAIDEYNHNLGLDKPLIVRYGNYMLNLAKGDFGTSYSGGKEVWPQIKELFPNTIRLSVLSMLFSVLIGLPIGVLSAVKQYSFSDRVSSIFAMILACMPEFWLCLLLLLTFSLRLHWLPAYGLNNWKCYVLPIIAMSANPIGQIIRLTRSSMLEEIRKDYIRTARAKGALERSVIFKHALRNSLIPVVTGLGSTFTLLLGNSVFIEGVFALPGVGRLIVNAINQNDTPTIVGCVVVISCCSVLINLGVDIFYAFLDPRIKAQYISTSKASAK